MAQQRGANVHAQDLSHGLENVPVFVECSDVSLLGYPTFEYTPVNVSGPGCITDPAEITLTGCHCLSQSCQSDVCLCLQRFGPTYSSKHQLLSVPGDKCSYAKPVFECNALCDCGEDCANRLVQHGVSLMLQVFQTEKSGWGLRAVEAISQGAFVCEYAGEVIGQQEARSRQLAQQPQDMNYIIAVREHSGEGHLRETYVDPSTKGNVGRFINHSCQPNLIMVPVRVHSMVPRLALFATRDITPDEELTFDYSGQFHNQGDETPNSDQNQIGQKCQGEWPQSLQRKPCYCGAGNCTGYLPLDISVLQS